MSEDFAATLVHLLDNALHAMNQAVSITAEQGPAAGVEWIADFLNDTDAVDDDIASQLPLNWLTQWDSK